MFRAFAFPILCIAALGAGCASEGERRQRDYDRYVKESVKAREKRQQEYRKWRAENELPAQGSSPEANGGGDWQVQTATGDAAAR